VGGVILKRVFASVGVCLSNFYRPKKRLTEGIKKGYLKGFTSPDLKTTFYISNQEDCY
jgi:hypothetical protein|tara:strand:- start:453 stop:626 length:174 start_codon:yes stop_codon:yes gene_type:complete